MLLAQLWLLAMYTNFIKRIVVASKNKPVGVVTERDISKFLEQDKTAKALNEIPVKYVIPTRPPKIYYQIKEIGSYWTIQNTILLKKLPHVNQD